MLNYYVRIPTSIYKNPNVTPFELVTYSYVQMSVVPYGFAQDVFISYDSISYFIYKKVNKLSVRYVREGVASLVAKNIIKVTNGIVKVSDFILNDNEYYSLVPMWAFEKILELDNKNKYDICYYLVWLLGTRNMETKTNTLSVEYLAELTGRSKRTLLSYNKILEDLNIICIARSGAINIDGKIHGIKNCYGLVGDNNKTKSVTSKKKMTADVKRALSAKLFYINKNPDKAAKYTEEELREIYDYCIKYNEDIKTHPEYDGKAKDISVLEQLLFF